LRREQWGTNGLSTVLYVSCVPSPVGLRAP
jgi:hypothetical protein